MTFDTADGEVDLGVLVGGLRLLAATGGRQERNADGHGSEAEQDEQFLHVISSSRFPNAISLC